MISNLKPVWIVSQMTFREMIRDKVMYIFALFFIVSLLISQLMSKLVVMEVYKVILDFTLAGFSLFGQLLAIFLGVSLVFKEIDKKTVWIILVRPVGRFSFLLGKFFGLSLVLLVFSLVFGAVATINCLRVNDAILVGVTQAIFLHFIETMVLLSICLMLSTVMKPLLGLFMAISIFMVGHMVAYLDTFLYSMKEMLWIKTALINFRYFFNLDIFNIRTEVVFRHALGWEDIAYRTVYGFALTVFFLMIALLFFKKRDF